MKRTYHLCLSGGDEILFRDTEDYNKGFNIFAIALYKTGSTGLVESFMSTHSHMMVQTENPKEFMHHVRQPYSKYFNYKYGRSGHLGEKMHFQLEITGLHHHLAAMSYTLRNALHHGVSSIPYAYPHSSANAIFKKEMGKDFHERLLPEKTYYKYIGRRAEYPSRYKMNENGLFLRETVLDIVQVENMYGTPRSFDFYMSRKTNEDWVREQAKDKTEASPVRLEDIEAGANGDTLEKMLIYEHGRSDYRKISDIDLCTEIDHLILPEMNRISIYTLSDSEKKEIAEYLYRKYRIGTTRLKRCLAM